MDFIDRSGLNTGISLDTIGVPILEIIQQIVKELDLINRADKDQNLTIFKHPKVGQHKWNLLILTQQDILLFKLAGGVDFCIFVVLEFVQAHFVVETDELGIRHLKLL